MFTLICIVTPARCFLAPVRCLVMPACCLLLESLYLWCYPLALELEAAGIELGGKQDLLDEAREAFGLLEHDLEQVARPHERAANASERPGPSDPDGQRANRLLDEGDQGLEGPRVQGRRRRVVGIGIRGIANRRRRQTRDVAGALYARQWADSTFSECVRPARRL